jgi:hypothetical protein
MHSSEGGRWGQRETKRRTLASQIPNDQIVTIRVNLDACTLQFWVNGKLHGPSWSETLDWALRFGLNMYYQYTAARIVQP